MIKQVTTFDGRKWNVPEEKADAFLTTYAEKNGFNNRADIMAQMQPANDVLEDMGQILRGDNIGGMLRNVVKPLGGARAEAFVRSQNRANQEKAVENFVSQMPPAYQMQYLKDPKFRQQVRDKATEDLYEMYKKNARESAYGYSLAHPDKATRLNIYGALGPAIGAAVLGTMATGGLGSQPAAAGLSGLLSGVAGGAATGALGGFLNEPSEKLSDRLATAGEDAFWGGTLGAIPVGLGGVAKTTGRVFRGVGKASTRIKPEEYRSAVLKSMGPTVADQELSQTLSLAVQSGEKGLKKEAFDIKGTLFKMKDAADHGYSMRAVKGADEILDAIETPEMKVAKEAYGDFVKTAKPKTGAGLTINNFFKEHSAAAKVYNDAIKAYPEYYGKLKISSFDGLQETSKLLDAAIEKSTKAPQLRALEKAREDFDKIIDNIYPTKGAVDKQYAIASTGQRLANDLAEKNLNRVNTVERTFMPELSATGGARLVQPAYNRGIAREIITGTRPGLSATQQTGLNALGFSIVNGLQSDK